MDPNKIKIKAIYKFLEQVVIYEDETGQLHIRAFVEDEGTEEERKVIQDLLLSNGFKTNNTKLIS